jgi:hypothetical protein
LPSPVCIVPPKQNRNNENEVSIGCVRRDVREKELTEEETVAPACRSFARSDRIPGKSRVVGLLCVELLRHLGVELELAREVHFLLVGVRVGIFAVAIFSIVIVVQRRRALMIDKALVGFASISIVVNILVSLVDPISLTVVHISFVDERLEYLILLAVVLPHVVTAASLSV